MAQAPAGDLSVKGRTQAMYVCSCRAVTDRTVDAAISAGARSIDDIAQLCSAGSRCRGCWPALQELLDRRQRPQGARRRGHAA